MKPEKIKTNQDITCPKVRLVDENGEQQGIVNTSEAFSRAKSVNLDLVEVAPQAKPPVCKIVDWGKEQYRQQKAAKASKSKQQQVQVKEVQLRPVTDSHDVEIKLNRAKKFIEKGNKVKFAMRFRGRELAHSGNGMDIMKNIQTDFEEIAQVERQPRLNGNTIIMILAPKAS